MFWAKNVGMHIFWNFFGFGHGFDTCFGPKNVAKRDVPNANSYSYHTATKISNWNSYSYHTATVKRAVTGYSYTATVVVVVCAGC